jgi:hypothetical protein
MNQDARRVHKELLESALDTVEEENDVLKQVARKVPKARQTNA